MRGSFETAVVIADLIVERALGQEVAYVFVDNCAVAIPILIISIWIKHTNTNDLILLLFLLLFLKNDIE